MPELIREPSRVAAAGYPPKLIDEYAGRASTGEAAVSIAHMRSPAGWAEPGQRPEFDEFTIVLRGALVVESDDGQLTASRPAQAVHASPGDGCATAAREPTAQSTSPSACPPSTLARSTAMTESRRTVLGTRHQAPAGSLLSWQISDKDHPPVTGLDATAGGYPARPTHSGPAGPPDGAAGAGGERRQC